MERASRVIGKLKFPPGLVSPEELARSLWPTAVGKTVAAHTRPAGVNGDHLVVEVEDAIWQRQLRALSGQIRARLNGLLGSEVVGHIEYLVVPPRRQMGRSSAATPATAAGDDAERIVDPVMRGIYRAARRKRLA